MSINEKCVRITQETVVGDPGKTNVGWEPGTTLNVVRGRPEFDSKGTTKHDLTRMEKILVSTPLSCQLYGRTGIFELERTFSEGDYEALPVDGLELMKMVTDKCSKVTIFFTHTLGTEL